MAKKKKFESKNAQLVGDTRLTQRQMKKFKAAYHNVQRDNQEIALENTKAQIAAGHSMLGSDIASLGLVDE